MTIKRCVRGLSVVHKGDFNNVIYIIKNPTWIVMDNLGNVDDCLGYNGYILGNRAHIVWNAAHPSNEIAYDATLPAYVVNNKLFKLVM